jgi:ABC-2 type transport system ATP-binding protein
VLYGPLEQVRRQYSGHKVRVRLQGDLPPLAGVEGMSGRNGSLELQLAASTTPQCILQQLVEAQAAVEHFEIAMPTLDEVFIRAVGEHADAA